MGPSSHRSILDSALGLWLIRGAGSRSGDRFVPRCIGSVELERSCFGELPGVRSLHLDDVQFARVSLAWFEVAS